MKATIKLVVALSGFAALANAASVSFSIASDTGAAYISNPGPPAVATALDSTFTAYIGRFNGTVTTTSVFADIQPNFTVLGSGAFASGNTAGAAGYFDAGVVNFTNAAGLAGQQFAVWFTNGSNLNAIVTGFGTIPSDSDIPNSKAFAIDASNVASLNILLGSYDPTSPNLATSGGNIILNNAIPEPSVALLGALGVLGLIRRRR